MRSDEYIVRCRPTITGAHFDLYILKRKFDDYKERTYYAKIEWVEYADNGYDLPSDFEPIRLVSYGDKSKNHSTRLMDDLWSAGVRPTGVKWSTDEVNALKDHIADLREITNKTLNKLTS